MVDPVDVGKQLLEITCPSTSLCVAGDSLGNIVTSTDPTGGSAAWNVGHVDDSQDYECAHYGGTGPQCAVGPSGISCPTASFCVLVDTAQGEYSSADPAAGASSWKGRGRAQPASEGFSGLACPSLTLCVTADGYQGQVVTWDPSKTPPATIPSYQFTTLPLSYSFVLGPVCLSSTTCFVTGGGASLIATSDPTGPASAWNLQYTDPAAAIASISCPTSSSCLAVDYSGNLIVGGDATPVVAVPPFPTAPSPPAAYPAAQLRADIRAVLTALKRAHLGALLKPRGYRTRFTAPVAGRITLTLDLTVSRPASTRHPPKILVATRSVNYSRPGELRRFAIKLNRTGRRLLKHRQSATLQVTIRFLSSPHTPILETQRLRLRR